MSKQCFKCLETKPFSEFYRHPKMGDGYLGKCKTCTKADVAERETRLRITDPEWTAKERERCRNKSDLARLLGNKPETSKAVKQAWYRRNKHKKKANTILNRAVKRGIVSKPSACNRCGCSGRLEGHHDNYSMPLAVEWLCTKCHGLTRRLDQ